MKYWRYIRELVEHGDADRTSTGDHQKHHSVDMDVDWANMSEERCRKIARRLSEPRLSSLIRGMVRTEGYFGVGSVTRTQFLLPIYARRFGTDLADKLAVWCKENTTNTYVPFGSGTCPERTYSGFIAWRGAKREQAKLQEQLRVERAARRSARISAQIEARNQSKKIRDADRSELIQSLSGLSPEMRLRTISLDIIALEAVPKELVSDCVAIAGHLNPEDQKALLTLIDRRRRGVWGQISRALVDAGSV